MSKKFLASVIKRSTQMTGVASDQLAGEIINAIKAEIISHGVLSIPSFGVFTVAERAKRNALNPSTGEKVVVKPSATVRFKASPVLRADAFAAVKKAKRRTIRGS